MVFPWFSHGLPIKNDRSTLAPRCFLLGQDYVSEEDEITVWVGLFRGGFIGDLSETWIGEDFHRKTMGKPWENHGKTIGKWRFTGNDVLP